MRFLLGMLLLLFATVGASEFLAFHCSFQFTVPLMIGIMVLTVRLHETLATEPAGTRGAM